VPSSPGYIRDLKRERATQLARGEGVDNAKRKKARRMLEKKGMVKPFDGKDVDHAKPLSKGGSNKEGNLRAVPKSENRSFPRTSSGAVKK
jgi:hypothetical protein